MEMTYKQFEKFEKEIDNYVREEKIPEEQSPESLNGVLATTIQKLDFKNPEDLKKMYKITKISRTEMGRILNSDGSWFFTDRGMEKHMCRPMMVNFLIPSLTKLPIDIQLEYNGHEFVKIPIDLMYWAPSWRNQEKHKHVFKIPSKDDSNKVLATLMASSELTSQSLNRYDTGLFLSFNYNAINNPELNTLVKSHHQMYEKWNNVFLKYFSKIIQKEPINISKESLNGLEKLCFNVPEWNNEPSEFNSMLPEKDLQQKTNEFQKHPEKYLEQIEYKAKKTYKIINRFTEFLTKVDSEMNYAKPK